MLNDRAFCVVVSAIAGLIAFIVLMRFLPDLSRAWPQLCTGDGCTVQGWMAASSGWFAVIIGGATMAYLGRQIYEQKKQTDFLIGDVLPTVDSIQHLEDPDEIVLRLVNWNRRSIMIIDADIVVEGIVTYLMGLKMDDENSSERIPPFFVAGWEDKSKAPHNVRITLSAVRKIDSQIVTNWPDGTTAFLDIEIVGEKHTKTRLTCTLRPNGR